MNHIVTFLVFAVLVTAIANGASPVCNGPNEHAGCGKPCDIDCNYLYREDPSCETSSTKCVDRCYCDEGYARERRVCVPIDKC